MLVADGGHLLTFVIDGYEYQYDIYTNKLTSTNPQRQTEDTPVTLQTTGGVTTVKNKGNFFFDEDNSTVIVNTQKGGKLTIDFKNAKYSYQASKQILSDYTEDLFFKAVDSDGDELSNVLTLNVYHLRAVNDEISTTTTTATISKADMLANDMYKIDPSFTVKPNTAKYGSVTQNGDDYTFTFDDANGVISGLGYFGYEIGSDYVTDEGTVTISRNNLVGTDANETFITNDKDTTVNAGGGDDTVNAGLGNDTINGDAGNDTLNGGDGDDTIKGGDDDDIINGGDGDDYVKGDAGNDTVSGGAGNDTVIGRDGDDTLNGGDGADKLYGDAGNDIMDGGDGKDKLYGSGGNDILRGGKDIDELRGEDGNDVLYWDGSDGRTGGLLDGGAGTDTIRIAKGSETNWNSGYPTAGFAIINSRNFEVIDMANNDQVDHLYLYRVGDYGSNNITIKADANDVIHYANQQGTVINGNSVTTGGVTFTIDRSGSSNLAPKSTNPADDDNIVGYSKDIEFTNTDTGAGFDTLLLNPNEDITLDFDKISDKAKNIEQVNMQDTSATGDKLTIDVKDVLDMTDGNNTLFIKGDSNDTVKLDNSEGTWEPLIGPSDKAGFNIYTSANGATLYIDNDIDNVIL